MNTLIMEYVLGEYCSRWSNGEQKSIPNHWFDEHPRSCAEDDGGYCSADSVPKYSTLMDDAMCITKTKPNLVMRVESATENWAAFSNIPFRDTNFNWKNVWAKAETMPLAICRAALMAS